jgi:hypothetical protein
MPSFISFLRFPKAFLIDSKNIEYLIKKKPIQRKIKEKED